MKGIAHRGASASVVQPFETHGAGTRMWRLQLILGGSRYLLTNCNCAGLI